MSESKLSGLIQVPLPFVQTYDEEGNIVDLPPLPPPSLIMFHLIERQPAPNLPIHNWKPISDLIAGKEQ